MEIMNIMFWLIFISLSIIYILIALLSSKNINNTNDYFLANRNYGYISITLSLIATQIGAGSILGSTEEIYCFGIYGLSYNIGTCLGFLLLSCGIASKLRKFNITTTAELFEKKYNSITLRKISSLLSIITLCGILAGQIIAFRKLLSIFNLDNTYIVLIFWSFIILYTMLGGIKSVVATDIFQIIVIISIFIIIIIYNIYHDNLSFITRLYINNLTYNSIEHKTLISKLLPCLMMPMLFAVIEQDLAQRFFSTKTSKTAILASIYSSIFIILLSLIPIFFGIFTKTAGILITNNINPMLTLIKNTNTDILLHLLICALIAAITSTGDSLLCAISTNINHDFQIKSICKIININLNSLHISKLMTLIFGYFALILAYQFNNIINIMIQSYELSISTLFISIISSFYKKHITKNAAILSIIFGLIFFIIFKIHHIYMQEIITLSMSFLGYVIGLYIPDKHKKNIT